MYKNHKACLIICFISISTFTYILNWDFTDISAHTLTISSIIIGIYIAVVSTLLGSKYAEKLFYTTDPKIKSKTMLGVLTQYIRSAGTSCVLLIILSCLFSLPYSYLPINLYRFVSSISYGLLSINICFMWLILKLLVNSLYNSAKQI